MINAVQHSLSPQYCPLPDLGVLHFSGPDARIFLQGQVSNDLQRLRGGEALLAGLHNPQGRVLALLRLLLAEPAAEGTLADVLAIMPAELLSAMSAHLRRFVLRAKLVISDASASWRVEGTCTADGALHYRLRNVEDATPESGVAMELAAWRAMEISAGVPEVYAATSGEFVAQMLNLDCLDGIAWKKGCYTGQEIIARAHFRGQVKRRMRRYAGLAGAPPAPGSLYTTSDGVGVRVVRSVALAGGGIELLAVAPLGAHSADELPLPYALPAPPEPTLTGAA